MTSTWLKRWFPGSQAGALPLRVREAIQKQEEATERLISWFQLFVVLTLGSLYMTGPKPNVGFDIIPWALATYLILTLMRLAWTHARPLPDWIVGLSAVVDILLLMALIWSFHLRYGQPPSFYLKAPTILYVFIFIALRALRFEARFVILTGLAACLGWGALMLYVLKSNPADSMITRDYVAYMTSNAILLGAEFDKIISILLVTTIIAVSLFRAKRLLIRAVSDQAAAQELSRFFAPEVAAKIKGSDREIRAGSGEIREAAILNLDMRGFTRFAATASPDATMSLLSDYQSQMAPVLRKHGGSIDKYLGDGIMATFGAATPSTTYAADALRALRECMAVAAEWQADRRRRNLPCPAVNGALASGPILFGAVGDERRLEYTVIGDAVNLSAKLEKANKETGARALCDGLTYERALAQGYEAEEDMPRLQGIEVAGLEAPIDLVVIAR
ncbi:MAG TPA: adenylate/guanylate cyclase domain-containing protein [Kiloniellaceae bacterium]|nr:adenylate/guanylate cyclase domain-containing protein [Kiloniellaceae bacterium]